jgi:hypothetical protein
VFDESAIVELPDQLAEVVAALAQRDTVIESPHHSQAMRVPTG